MDPITIALIGGGIAAGGSIISSIMGAMAKEKEIKAQKEMFREQKRLTQEAIATARERVGRYARDYEEKVGRILGIAGRDAEELLGKGYAEFRAGLEKAIEEYQIGLERGIGEARERVGKEYDIAMQLAEHLARSEIQRRMDLMGMGGTGASVLMQQRAVMQAVLPLLTSKAEMVAGLERQILGERARAGETILAERGKIAGSFVEEAGAKGKIRLGVASDIARLQEDIFKTLAGIEVRGMEAIAGITPSPGMFYQPGAELYLAGVGRGLEQAGMGLAMAGAGAGGGGKGG